MAEAGGHVDIQQPVNVRTFLSDEQMQAVSSGHCVEYDAGEQHVLIVPVKDGHAPAIPRFRYREGAQVVYIFHSVDASALQHLTFHQAQFDRTTDHRLPLETLTFDECVFQKLTIENVNKVILKNCTVQSLVASPGTIIEIVGYQSTSPIVIS